MELDRLSSAQLRIQVWLFGAFQIWKREGIDWREVGRKEWHYDRTARKVFARLLVARGRRLTRSILEDDLWGESSNERIYTAMNRLRSVIGKDLIKSVDGGYALAGQERIWTDLDAVRDIMRQVGRRGPLIVEEAVPLLEEAQEILGRGELLEEEDGTWVHALRAEVERMKRQSGRWLAQAYMQQGKWWQAREQYRMLVEGDPGDEDSLREWLRLLMEEGGEREARKCYQEIARRAEEEGIKVVPWKQLGLVERPDHMLRCQYTLAVPISRSLANPTAVAVAEQPTVGSHVCLALVVQRAGDEESWTGVRRRLQEELEMPLSNNEHHLSRRQALAAIAALPLAALTSRALPPAEEFLPLCAAANAACNHLMNSDGLDKAHAALSCYLPVLEQLAYTGSSSYRPAAARLAAEGKRMAGCIETHRGDPQAKHRLSLEAVRLAALSDDPSVRVMAVRDLALAYYYSGQIEQMRTHLQPALVILDQCPPLLQSGTLFLQAALEARLGQPQTALRLVGQAQNLFSRRADGERLPDFRFEEDNVIMWTGRVHLHLAERGRPHIPQARKAFEQSSRVKAATPPRLLAEIELDMARTALIQQDLDAFSASLGESIHLANRLGSVSLRREARAIYQQVRTGHPWSAERPIKEMEDLFTARTV